MLNNQIVLLKQLAFCIYFFLNVTSNFLHVNKSYKELPFQRIVYLARITLVGYSLVLMRERDAISFFFLLLFCTNIIALDKPGIE